MKEVLLANNKGVAIVDDEDLQLVSQYKWYLNKNGSAHHRHLTDPSKSFYMHRLIMNPPKGMKVDHINHDTLDNRRCNLRVCTTTQNGQNRVMRKSSRTGFKGVAFSASRVGNREKVYSATITVNGVYMFLGWYMTPQEAAHAYNEAAVQYFGEFAYLNKF